MKTEERVCVVLTKELQDSYRYAVFRRTKGWEGWELVKGHVEDDDPEATVYIELAEEAGINREQVVRVEPLDQTMSWTYENDDGETVETDCHCFLAEVTPDTYISVGQNPDDEHTKGHFLNYRDAHDILTHDNQRELLEAVKNQLS